MIAYPCVVIKITPGIGNFSPDTLGTEESVLISGVTMYTNMVFGTAKCVEVSSFQCVLDKGFRCIHVVCTYIIMYVYNKVYFPLLPSLSSVSSSLPPHSFTLYHGF